MGILPKAQIEHCLWEYYRTYLGESTADVWYDQPAVNVWLFQRDEKLIILKCDIITGEVSEKTET